MQVFHGWGTTVLTVNAMEGYSTGTDVRFVLNVQDPGTMGVIAIGMEGMPWQPCCIDAHIPQWNPNYFDNYKYCA